jgi:threonine dehydrogenase-like Zn-dependent dehydrogenase
MGAEMCDISRGDVVAVWGAGPVGQFAIASARMLGAEQVIAIDRFPYRLQMALEKAGATAVLNYEERPDVVEALKEMTGGRGPDACIDAVGMEAHHGHAPIYAYVRAWMNRSITMRTGQCHVHRYMRPLLERIEAGDIDPSFIVTHQLALEDASRGYETFKHKREGCVKVVLKP